MAGRRTYVVILDEQDIRLVTGYSIKECAEKAECTLTVFKRCSKLVTYSAILCRLATLNISHFIQIDAELCNMIVPSRSVNV